MASCISKRNIIEFSFNVQSRQSLYHYILDRKSFHPYLPFQYLSFKHYSKPVFEFLYFLQSEISLHKAVEDLVIYRNTSAGIPSFDDCSKYATEKFRKKFSKLSQEEQGFISMSIAKFRKGEIQGHKENGKWYLKLHENIHGVTGQPSNVYKILYEIEDGYFAPQDLVK